MKAPAILRQIRHSGRSGRIAMIGAVVAAMHLVLFALLAQWRGPRLPPKTTDAPISVMIGINLGALNCLAKSDAQPMATPVATAPPKIESVVESLKLAPRINPLSNVDPILIDVKLTPPAPPVAKASSAASAPPVGGGATGRKSCEIFDVVQAALKTRSDVGAAIAVIPRSARSVANAILVWDGRWIAADAMGGPTALSPIQKAVLESVAQAPPDCQGDTVRGPRLITVGDEHNTTVLAFGSGVWRWSDLVATAAAP